jgi:hypothetical protein
MWGGRLLSDVEPIIVLKQNRILIFGDILAIALVTVIGFATHGDSGLSFLPRMLAAFIPLTVGWILLAPPLGLFRSELISNPRQLWRPVFAMLFVGPFAVVLRGLILNAPIIPVFAVVLSATSAFGMLVWRGLYFLFTRNRAE